MKNIIKLKVITVQIKIKNQKERIQTESNPLIHLIAKPTPILVNSKINQPNRPVLRGSSEACSRVLIRMTSETSTDPPERTGSFECSRSANANTTFSKMESATNWTFRWVQKTRRWSCDSTLATKNSRRCSSTCSK